MVVLMRVEVYIVCLVFEDDFVGIRKDVMFEDFFVDCFGMDGSV